MFESITREELLKIIGRVLNKIDTDHRSRRWQSCLEGTAIARDLIELIEAADCGSHGGYDPEDPNCGKHGFGPESLRSRYNWLKEKLKK